MELSFLFSPKAEVLLREAEAERWDALKAQSRWRTTLNPELARQLTEQLALRARARHKLPEWVEAGCRFQGSLLEQSTNPQVAQARFDALQGTFAVDLCGGLGVDTVALARKFKVVVAVERDPVRAGLLQHNLARLGVTNVDVHVANGLVWLENALEEELKPDFVFVDPARRDEQDNRSLSLSDLSPQPAPLIRLARQHELPLWVKLSPMLDATEGARLLGPVQLTCISLEGECKEWTYEVLSNDDYPLAHSALVLRKGERWGYQGGYVRQVPAARQDTEYACLIEPDVALYLTDQAEEVVRLAAREVRRWGHWFLAHACKLPFAGRVLRLVREGAWHRKTFGALLQELDISQANIAVRGLPTRPEELYKLLNLRPGGTDYLFFTQTDEGARYALCRYA